MQKVRGTSRQLYRVGTVALLLFLLWCCVPAKAWAASDAQTFIVVNQKFTAEGTAPSNIFTYRLTAQSASNPMPEGSTEGVYEFTLAGDATEKLGPLVYDAEGIYTYELKQAAGAEKGYTYDKEVYTIIVTVYDGGSGKLAAFVGPENSQGVKLSEDVVFQNSYKDFSAPKKPPVTVTKPPVTVTKPPVTSTLKAQVKTGDETRPLVWILLLSGALICAGGIVAVQRNRKKTEEKH